jgi:hypothetical protein
MCRCTQAAKLCQAAVWPRRWRPCCTETRNAFHNPLREILAVDELHHEAGHASAFFEAVDGGDVGMVQRGKDFASR